MGQTLDFCTKQILCSFKLTLVCFATGVFGKENWINSKAATTQTRKSFSWTSQNIFLPRKVVIFHVPSEETQVSFLMLRKTVFGDFCSREGNAGHPPQTDNDNRCSVLRCVLGQNTRGAEKQPRTLLSYLVWNEECVSPLDQDESHWWQAVVT